MFRQTHMDIRLNFVFTVQDHRSVGADFDSRRVRLIPAEQRAHPARVERHEPAAGEGHHARLHEHGGLARELAALARRAVAVACAGGGLAAALDANLSMVSVRQNEITAQQNAVVKQLTLVATVFLPLTFLTGFFGQNFGWMVRHIGSDTAFFALGVGGLVVACIALYAWFRRGGYTTEAR